MQPLVFFVSYVHSVCTHTPISLVVCNGGHSWASRHFQTENFVYKFGGKASLGRTKLFSRELRPKRQWLLQRSDCVLLFATA